MKNGILKDSINEVIFGSKGKKKDRMGNDIFADEIENGVHIIWKMSFDNYLVIWYKVDDEDTFGQELFLNSQYSASAAKYQKILKDARAGKVKFDGTKSNL